MRDVYSCTLNIQSWALSPSLADAGERTGPRFLILDPHATRDLDALGLRRAGAMQTFGQIADGISSDRHVLDQPQDAHPVNRIDAAAALQELADQRANLVVLQVVCTENLNPGVVVMKPAKDRSRADDSNSLNGTRDRRIFIQ